MTLYTPFYSIIVFNENKKPNIRDRENICAIITAKSGHGSCSQYHIIDFNHFYLSCMSVQAFQAFVFVYITLALGRRGRRGRRSLLQCSITVQERKNVTEPWVSKSIGK